MGERVMEERAMGRPGIRRRPDAPGGEGNFCFSHSFSHATFLTVVRAQIFTQFSMQNFILFSMQLFVLIPIY